MLLLDSFYLSCCFYCEFIIFGVPVSAFPTIVAKMGRGLVARSIFRYAVQPQF